MTEQILELIASKVNQSRDLVVDELADLFEANHLSEAAKTQAVLSLVQIVEKEEDSSVVESIYNLFGIAFFENICTSEITEKCVEMLDRLKPGSIVHALPIIADSDLPNKKELILQQLKNRW